MRIVSSALAIAIVMLAVSPAYAQAAEAETLFREGKRLLKQGRVAEACDKLEASERIDPQVGTELNLADCREKNGQTSSAWAMFVKAAANAKHADQENRAAEARRRASVLEHQLVYLTISVPAASVVDELVITRNGTAIDRALWDQPVPVDPDEYTIAASAPGRTSWSVTLAVKTSSKVVEVPPLERATHETVPHATDDRDRESALNPPRVPPRERPRTPPPPHRDGGPRAYRATTIALASVGIGAVAVGTGFGLYSVSLEHDADAVCPSTSCTDAHAVELNRLARRDGWIANVGWGVGGVALAGALVAWWVGRPAGDDAVSVVPIAARDQAGFAVAGRF